jgi:hypothetical protein
VLERETAASTGLGALNWLNRFLASASGTDANRDALVVSDHSAIVRNSKSLSASSDEG